MPVDGERERRWFGGSKHAHSHNHHFLPDWAQTEPSNSIYSNTTESRIDETWLQEATLGHFTMTVAGKIAEKAVHLKIQPRTSTIRESREILRALKRYGPVVTFRNLQV